jgi:hypothetical protein
MNLSFREAVRMPSRKSIGLSRSEQDGLSLGIVQSQSEERLPPVLSVDDPEVAHSNGIEPALSDFDSSQVYNLSIPNADLESHFSEEDLPTTSASDLTRSNRSLCYPSAGILNDTTIHSKLAHNRFRISNGIKQSCCTSSFGVNNELQVEPLKVFPVISTSSCSSPIAFSTIIDSNDDYNLTQSLPIPTSPDPLSSLPDELAC